MQKTYLQLMTVKRTISGTLLVLFLLAGVAVAENTSASLHEQYRELRKALLICSTLPPKSQGFRAEHLQFLRNSTAFINSLSEEKETDKPYLAAAHAARGTLLLHCGRLGKAREDFDKAIELSEPRAQEGENKSSALQLPVGTPEVPTMKLYRAFTFIDDGADAFVAETKKIDKATMPSGQAVLRDKVKRLAESLVARNKYDEAIAVYRVIKEFDLWDPDKDQDPERVIGILKTQKENLGGG